MHVVKKKTKKAKHPDASPGNTAPLLAALALAATAAAVIGLVRFSQTPLPDVPDVDRDALERPVAEKIQNFRTSVFEAPEAHDAWGDLGVIYHAHGFEEEAAVCYQKALELDPSDFRWHYLLVHALLHFDRVAALEQTARALEVRTDYPALHVVRAKLLEEEGRVDEAKALYAEALTLDDRSASAALALGRMAMSDGDLEAARKYLERAAEVSDAGPVYATLARFYRQSGERDKALEAAQKVTTAIRTIRVGDPIHYQMLQETVTSTERLARAQDFADEGNVEQAESIYRDLVDLRPDDADMRVRLADVLLRQNRDVEAREHYRAALDINPDHAGAHGGLGAVLARDGDYEEAEKHFQASLAVRDDHVGTIASYAGILAIRGRSDEALEMYRRAIELEPDNVSARRSVAAFLLRSNRYQEAAEHLRRVVDVAPDLGVAHLQLGAALAAIGDYPEAASHLERAIELGETVPDPVRERVENGLKSM